MGDGHEIMVSSLLASSMSSRTEVSPLRSPIPAEELLGLLRNTEPDAPILLERIPAWSGCGPG